MHLAAYGAWASRKNPHVKITMLLLLFGNKSSAVAEMGYCGHIRHAPQRVGTAVRPFSGARSPSNTTWHLPRPAFVPSGILIYPAVWSQ